MLLSESEKNTIRSLYGLVNEDETVPPDESVLIANKNPFKYGEYLTSRRFYNQGLKEGDTFFVAKPTLTNYIEEKIKENFDNKTLRFSKTNSNEDIIGTLVSDTKFKVYTTPPVGVKLKQTSVGTQCIEYFVLLITKDSKDPSSSTLGTSADGIYFNPQIGFEYLIVSDEDEYLQSFNRDIENIRKKSATNWISKSQVVKINVPSNSAVKSKVFSFSNWNTIPDEYFEIRKVQRKQTDF